MSKLPPPPAAKPPAPKPSSPPRPNGGPPPAAKVERHFNIVSGRQVGAQRVGVYGPGGVGKSKLCSLLPHPLFIDLENGSRAFDVARVDGIETLADVRAVLQSDIVDPFSEVVIDTATKLEELALAHIVAHVPHEKPGVKITGVESYGFGKGYRHLYDAFSLVLQDCDRLIRKGKHVVLIAHSCTNEAPNPSGDNWLRYEPRLQNPKKENSVRERVIGWADHVLFIGYDVVTSKDGKGVGSGTRTIYTQELPTHIAKTRGALDPAVEMPLSLPYPDGDNTIWQLLLGGAK
jgi:hypothetical protein